jgi:Uma2 family endonuclease
VQRTLRRPSSDTSSLTARRAKPRQRRMHPQVEIYRPGQEPEILEAPTEIDCGEVMPGFVLSMSRIW